MKRHYHMFIVLSITSFPLYAENTPEKNSFVSALLPTRISGYVKHESYWDTRQVVGSRDDETLFFPEPQKRDPNCDDINAKGQFQMADVKSRLRLDFEGKKLKNADLSGVIETDFAGTSDVFNILRLRKAYVKFTWDTMSLLAGQQWHPTYIIGLKPRVVASNSGRPIAVNARNPQLRFQYYPTESLRLQAVASTELDSVSDGPIGTSSTYMRNSIIPMFDMSVKYEKNNNAIGFDAGYKRIQPRLMTDTGLKTRETLSSATVTVFSQLQWDIVSTRNTFIFSQNGRDLNLMGGYAVATEDSTTNKRTYANLNQISFWNDTQFSLSHNITPGWYIGISKNLGATKCILLNEADSKGNITTQRIFGRGTDIDTLFRFAPRVKWKVNNFKLGLEIEYTRAAYGTITQDGDVVNTVPVGNTRLQLTLWYYL